MDGKVVIGCDLDTRNFDAQIDYVESQMQEIEYKLKQADMGFEVGDTQKLEAEYEKLGIRLDSLRKKQAKLNQEQANMGKLDLSGVQKGLNNVNNEIQGAIKKVAHWGIAVFGIRTAYDAVRGAMSTLSQYDTQMVDNIEYIRYALASTLQPVIQTILNLVVRLLQYINYIAKAWTGKNLFKTADTFKSAQKSASGVAKSAKEINKQLAGFDEMNVLSDTSSSGADGGGTDISAPNIDLTGMQGEVPQWLQWIVDNKDVILSILAGIAAGILAINLGASGLMGLGIGLIVAGIVYTIQAIIDYINDPSWDNFAKILEGLALILAGVALAMIAVNAANPVGWIILAIAAVTALVALIIKNWDKIKEVLGKVGDWINEHVIKPVADFFKGLWDKIKGIFEPVIDFFKNIWETVKENIQTSVDNIKKIFTFLWDKIKEIFNPVIDWFKDKFQKAYEKIKEVFSPIADFFGKMWDKIKNKLKDFGAKVGEVVGGAFKAVINGVLKAIENILNFPIKAINKLITTINKVPGINLGKLSTFSLPRLAKGGIINQPGRGIPVGYGQAIAGERRAEGVIPLTDSQQMQLLGESIGRYVTINASITNTMNGRVISRELQKVNNTNNFAFNS